jgi:hypothetical protein
MSNEDRYVVIYDEGDWILDQETGEYIDIEQACNKLNDYEENMGAIGSFVVDFNNMLNKAGKKE